MEQTIICAKMANDAKVYAIERTSIGTVTGFKKYLYDIVCLDKEEGDTKLITDTKYYRLSTVRRMFRKIPTMYSRG